MILSIRSLRGSCLIACAAACAANTAMAVDRYVAANANGTVPNQYRTIGSAMAALQPGDTLTIAAGVYHETIQFPSRNWSASTPTVVQGSDNVIIDGADVVTGWTQGNNGVFYVNWPTEPEEVIVNGTLLQQIGGTVFGGFPVSVVAGLTGLLTSNGGIWPGRVNGDATTLTNNSFYYDKTAKRLYVHTSYANLNQQVVEASTRAHGLLALNVAGVQIKNLNFRYGNTSLTGRDGFVTISGQHVVVSKVAITNADSVGMEVDGDDNQIVNSSANYCGQVGIKARGARMQMVSNETDYNNTRGFNTSWEAGGAKFTGNNGLTNSKIQAHTAIGNHGDGIWFDWGNQNDIVEYSTFEYNSGYGIQYEASSGAQIFQNSVIANGKRGIYLPSSSNSTVHDNLVAANHLEGIAIIDEGRTDPNGRLNLHPIGNTVSNNVVAWNGYALTIPGTTFATVADRNRYVGQGLQLTYWNTWSDAISTLAKWQQVTNLDLHSIQVNLPIDLVFAKSIQAQARHPDLSWVQRLPPISIAPTAAAARFAAFLASPTIDGSSKTGAVGPLANSRGRPDSAMIEVTHLVTRLHHGLVPEQYL